MFFRLVTSMEVYNIINLRNPNKSCGSDGIKVKYLRSAAMVIAPVGRGRLVDAYVKEKAIFH